MVIMLVGNKVDFKDKRSGVVCVCVCERERERERVSVCVCVCGVRACVRACVRVRQFHFLYR